MESQTSLSDFSVSLLTPASDLVLGSDSEFEALFGRAGNDVFYGFDPAFDYPEVNIDFLFGDVFDNSAAEFDVLRGITSDRPLAILDVDIPSVGRDRFVLGDELNIFYTDPDPIDLLTSNLFGTNEFAVIYDFGADQDIIQLGGERKDYILVELNDLEVEGAAQSFSGEGIFYTGNNGIPDLVGYIVSTPEQDYSLNDRNVFDYTGNSSSGGGVRNATRIGTQGIDRSQNATADSSGNVYVIGSTAGSLGGAN